MRIILILLTLLTIGAEYLYAANSPAIYSTPFNLMLGKGGLKFQQSDTTTTCAAGTAGSLRNNAGTIEACNGSAWSAIGAAGANTALSNLASVAFNTDLLPDSNAAYSLGSATLRMNTVYTQNIQSGDTNLAIKSTNQAGNNTGNVSFKSGDASGGAFNSGTVTIGSGNGNGAGGASGDFNITTGTGNVTSGSISLTTGSSSGTRGSIKLVDGSEGTAGYVWTSTAAVDGTGTWSNPSAALSRLTAATGTNTIANANNAQVWNWDTLTTETALKLGSTSFTSGKLLQLSETNNSATATGNVADISVTGASSAAVGLAISHAGTDANAKGLYVNMTGTTGVNYGAHFASASTSAGTSTVFINNTATSGTGYGLITQSFSTTDNARTGYFSEEGTSGNTYALYVTSQSNGATARGGYFKLGNGGAAGFAVDADAQGSSSNTAGRFQNSGSANTGTSLVSSNASTSSSAKALSATLSDATAAGEVARLTHSGSSGYALDVNGTGSGQRALVRLRNTVTAANNSGSQIMFSANRTGTADTDVAGVSGIITDITAGAYLGALVFKTANNAAPAERMRITSGGNVGIGVDPAHRLSVGSTADTTNYIQINTGATSEGGILFTDSGANSGSVRYDHNADAMYFKTVNTERLRINSNGLIGAGTSAPSSTLTVVSRAGASGAESGVRISDNETDATNKIGRVKAAHYTNAEEPMTMMFGYSQSAVNDLYIGGGSGSENAATTIMFRTAANNTTLSGSERLRITSNGHLEYTGTAPTVSSGAGDCGTSPAIVGNDNVGRVTVGSSTNGGFCTITFAGTWTNTPICVVNNDTTGVLVRATNLSTTAFRITGVIVAGDALSYTCFGRL